MVKIEEGKFYRTRDGRKVGPVSRVISDFTRGTGFVWKTTRDLPGGLWFTDAGVCEGAQDGERLPGYDLVAEWVDTPEIDLTAITTPYGLLPEEVQRALVKHKGAVQAWGPLYGWMDTHWPVWSADSVYRAKLRPPEPPKPVVKDVSLVVWVDGVKTRTTWTFTDGQMTPVAAVEVLK